MIPSIYDYLPEHADGLMKTAEMNPELKRRLKVVGKSVVYPALGAATGVGAMAAIDRLNRHVGGVPAADLAKLLPVLGLASGIGYQIYKAHHDEEWNRGR